MSFTTGGLFYAESLSLLELYDGDWGEVSLRALERNTLQSRVASTAKRVLREIVGRLRMLESEELALLREGSSGEQKYLLWLGICRRYRFIAEFASEVVRERYLTLKHDLPSEEFDLFYRAKEAWHPELERIADSTRNKLRAVLYRMLREAEIVDENHLILPAVLTEELVRTIAKRDIDDLMIFPISDSDLQRMMA
jgi:hypothetical protein